MRAAVWAQGQKDGLVMNMESGFAGRVSTLDSDDVGSARKRRVVTIGAIVLVLVAVVGAWAMFHGKKTVAPAADIAPRVTFVVPGTKSVTNIVAATGTLAARRELPVGVAGEGGMIQQVLVEPGQWVSAGQALATIDRAVAAQQTSQMVASTRMAEADARVAQSELDRAQKLVGRGFISQADIDRKTAVRDAARAKVNLARAQTGEMSARMGRLVIRAPAAGLVLARMVEPGQIVSSGTGMLFRMAKGGEMELRAQLAEQDLASLAIGKSADVTPIGSNHSFTGQIWQLSPVIDPATRQGIARVALKYDPALRPGGFAAVRIESGAVQAPLLPESAVLSDDKGNYVYVVGGDNKVQRRAVTTGQVSGSGIAILSGLAGNERVVLSAGAFLNPGDRVIPERAPARS